MRTFIFSCLFTFIASFAISQNVKPVTWDFEVKQNEDASYTLTVTAKMKGDWAIYSQHTEKGGPIPLKFTYEDGIELLGDTREESEVIKKMSELFELEVIKFKKEAVFTQKFMALGDNSSIKGTLTFMCCDDMRCLPPTEVVFDVAL